MVENQDSEKRYISLSQAREMAIRTARASPARRHWMLPRRMVFDFFNDYEDEDTYTIVISFRPEGDFAGTPGQEQFKFRKTGEFEAREVLNPPKSSMRFVIKGFAPALGVVAVVVVIAVVVLVLVRSDILTRYRGAGSLESRGEIPIQDRLSTLPAQITNVSRFATGYTLELRVDTFSLPQTDIDVRTTALSGFTTEAATQFIRRPTLGIGVYSGTVRVSTEFIEDPSLNWVRDNITVELLIR